MTSALSTSYGAKPACVLALLGRDHAGERDAAALAVHRTIRSAGLAEIPMRVLGRRA